MAGHPSRKSIIQSVFSLEARKGHLRWTIMDISRATKFSRSLVYYHFGRSKKEILLKCLRELANDFYGLSNERQGMALLDSLEITHRLYKSAHAFPIFFQKWREVESVYRDIILEAEAKFEANLQRRFPRAGRAQIRALHGLLHGLATAPYLNRDTLAIALGMLRLRELGYRG